VGFFQGYRFLNPEGLAYGFLAYDSPPYDTNMLLKAIFDKTAFVKFKISNTLKQNIGKTLSKQPKILRKIHTSLWIVKISRKNLGTKSLETFEKCF
jgi:hypothetical protein